MLQDTKKFLLEQIKIAQIIQIDAGMITQQGHIVPYIYRWLYREYSKLFIFQNAYRRNYFQGSCGIK